MPRMTAEQVERAAEQAQTDIVNAPGAADALNRAEGLTMPVLRELADLCYIEHDGRSKRVVAREVTRECGWSV